MTTPYRPHLLLRLPCCLALLAAATAQCEPAWLPGNPAGGPAGTVSALLTLPGGELVAGGVFRVADAAEVRNLARWDGSTWRSLGSGSDAEVTSLVRLPNGDLVAGGRFTTMNGVPCARIARFDGASWSPIGTGFDGDVLALLVLQNGALVAGGSFDAAGATSVSRVAQWSGTSWVPMGTGFANGAVLALAQRSGGEVVAAGAFLDSTASGVLQWNGSTWSQVNGFDNTSLAAVRSLAALPNGDLALAGAFALGGSSQSLAIWNGTAMQPFSPPVPIALPRVLATANGDLVVAGSAPSGVPSVARWNGAQWTTLAGAPPTIDAAVETANGELVVGARATVQGHAVGRFDGTSWQPVGAPLPPQVQDMVRLPNDDVVVGGSFTSFAGIAANRLARFDGSGWTPLGPGVGGDVSALAAGPNGSLIVSGSFQNAGVAPANHIARFDGANWSTLGAGIPEAATALAVAPDGRVAALRGGTLRLFDGLNWSALQVPDLVAGVSLAFLDSSRLAIGGVYLSGPTPIGRLLVLQNGTFTPVPGAPLGISQMLVEASGDLLVASVTGVRRLSGGVWSTEIAGQFQALARLPNGDLLAAGAVQSVPGTSWTTALWRRTPNGWQGFAAIDGGVARRVVVTSSGRTFAAGSFLLADGEVSFGFAQGLAPCAASVQSVGAGCSGGAGPVTLAVADRAWIGGTLRAQATGMTTNSLAVQAVGVVPTQLPLPGGAAGCGVFVTPSWTELLLPSAGIATVAVAVPRDPSIVGMVLRLQVVGVELDLLGLVRLTSTNALDCTVGAL